MDRKVTLITGGQRSGKSSFAMKMALSESGNPVYLATSRVYDEEHRLRIERHKRDREGQNWETIEEDSCLSKHDLSGRVVVIDCVTLLTNNVFFDTQNDEKCLEILKNDYIKFTEKKAHFIFVTNEIGMGEQSMNSVQRRFTSVLGWFNQFISANSDETFLMVSGLPVKVK